MLEQLPTVYSPAQLYVNLVRSKSVVNSGASQNGSFTQTSPIEPTLQDVPEHHELLGVDGNVSETVRRSNTLPTNSLPGTFFSVGL